LGTQGRRHAADLPFLHVVQQPAHEIRDEIRAQGPARAEIAEYPSHIRHTGEHHAAIGDGIGEDERLTVDREGDVAERAEVKPGGGDNDVGLEALAALQLNAALGEALDVAAVAPEPMTTTLFPA